MCLRRNRGLGVGARTSQRICWKSFEILVFLFSWSEHADRLRTLLVKTHKNIWKPSCFSCKRRTRGTRLIMDNLCLQSMAQCLDFSRWQIITNITTVIKCLKWGTTSFSLLFTQSWNTQRSRLLTLINWRTNVKQAPMLPKKKRKRKTQHPPCAVYQEVVEAWLEEGATQGMFST